MIAVYAPVPRQQFHDGNGPISGGRVTYYEAGTSTPKAIYSAPDALTPVLNPQILDQDGYVREGGVFFGEGSYKIVVEKPVAPVAPGEIPDFVEVYGTTTYDGTYPRVADDLLGNPVWENDSDSTLRIKISGGLYFLYDTAAPSVALSTRLQTLGIFGVWSPPGMTVGYPSYEVYWTMDDIAGAPVADPTQSASFLPLMEDLRAIPAGVAGQLAYISGYYEIGDGGEGWFAWDGSSVEADNGGTIIAPPSSPATGRWLRLLEEEYLTPNLFGSIPGSELVSASSQQAMANWALAHDLYKAIRIPAGEYNLGGNLTFTGALHLIVEDGAKYVSPDLAATLTITCQTVEIIARSPIVDPSEVTLQYDPVDPSATYRPEWAGAAGSGLGTTDDWPAFLRIATCNLSATREITLGGMYNLVGGSAGISYLSSAFFEQGSKLLCGFANRQVRIGQYRTQGNTPGIFGGDNPQAVGLMDSDRFTVAHLDPEVAGFLSETDLINACTIATGYGTHYGTLVFDETGTIVMDEAFDILSTSLAKMVSWEIQSGTLLETNASIFIPKFSGGVGAISASSSSSPLFGCPIDPRWFGAVAGVDDATVAASNTVALTAAMACATASYPASLEGGNSPFYVDGQILVAGSGGLKLRQLILFPYGTFGAGYLLKSTLAGRHDIFDCIIGDGATSSLWITTGSNVEIGRSRFYGAVTYDDTSGTFDASDTDFRGLLTADLCPTVRTRHCLFSDGAVLSGTSGYLSDSQFTDCSCDLMDPAAFLVCQNRWVRTDTNAKLNLKGSAAGWVVDGLVVESNSWSSGSSYTGITVANMAATGHRVRIDGNSSVGVVLPGSVARVRHTETASTLAAQYWTSNVSLNGLYILPYGTVPVRALAQLVGETVTPSGREEIIAVPVLSGTVHGTTPAALANVAMVWEMLNTTPFVGDTYDWYLEFTLSDVN